MMNFDWNVCINNCIHHVIVLFTTIMYTCLCVLVYKYLACSDWLNFCDIVHHAS